MYCAYDGKNVVAFHKKRKVVEFYCARIYQNHQKVFYVGKISKKKLANIEDFDDLYLREYQCTFLQSGYIEYLEIALGDIVAERIELKIKLEDILNVTKFNSKTQKIIKKGIDTVETAFEKDAMFTPELAELKQMKLDYEQYSINRYYY